MSVSTPYFVTYHLIILLLWKRGCQRGNWKELYRRTEHLNVRKPKQWKWAREFVNDKCVDVMNGKYLAMWQVSCVKLSLVRAVLLRCKVRTYAGCESNRELRNTSVWDHSKIKVQQFSEKEINLIRGRGQSSMSQFRLGSSIAESFCQFLGNCDWKMFWTTDFDYQQLMLCLLYNVKSIHHFAQT